MRRRAFASTRALSLLCIATALTGCVAEAERARWRAQAHLGSGPTYDIGPIQVTLVAPERVAYECGVPCAGGCVRRNFFGRDSKEYERGLRHKLIAIDDTYVILHEFKHALEPNWTHPGNLPLGDGDGCDL